MDSSRSITAHAPCLRRALARTMTRTIAAWDLIRPHDRVLVAVSGGKDSYTLVDLLEEARRRAPSVRGRCLPPRPGAARHDAEPLRRWLESTGIPFEIHHEDTYSAVIKNAEETDRGPTARLLAASARYPLHGRRAPGMRRHRPRPSSR